MRLPPSVRTAGAVAALALFVAAPARSQAIGQGFSLERAGQLREAADLYVAAVRRDSTNLAALLGLERVLPRLNRLRDLVPLAQRAVELRPTSGELQSLLVRLYVALHEPDSAEALARRWARAGPRDADPYRAWAIALENVGEYGAAREVLLAGRQALGQPTAFAVELAAVRAATGEWESAAREWLTVVTAAPGQVSNASAQLFRAPRQRREAIIQVLTGGYASVPARQLAATLILSWGDPLRAWATFEPTVSDSSAAVVAALHGFAELAAGPGTPAASRVRGLALSRLAEMVPPPLATRARADAGRALLEAGDAGAARVQLERAIADSTAPPDAQQLARAALIRALIADNMVDSAAALLAGAGDRLTGVDQAALRFALARARIHRGELALADSALADDSSIEADAAHGWIALYRGDLTRAAALFRAAGPYAGDRRDATERTAMLALIQRIPEGRLPALGSALLLLARGDSARAVTALRQVADQLMPALGRADVLLLAGQVAVRMGGDGSRTAATLFREVVRIGGGGAAPPAAELEWARLLLRQGLAAAAVQHLEHLILTYPESAVVPEARRELERAQGAIPKS